jgi:septation ring formation regulator EzrA
MSIKGGKINTSLINIKAGIQHLKDLSRFYKYVGEEMGCGGLEEDLKELNEKLRRMYDIVKNDAQYMKRSYKASAHMIQDMLENREGKGNKYDPYENDD